MRGAGTPRGPRQRRRPGRPTEPTGAGLQPPRGAALPAFGQSRLRAAQGEQPGLGRRPARSGRPRPVPGQASQARRDLKSAVPRRPSLSLRRHMRSPLETPISDTTERAMSPEALELELDRLHPAAFGWAIACCAGDRAAAEDALQASYLKILDGRTRFDGRASFRTWLFAVVRNTAAELRRRAALRRLLPLAVLGATPDGRPDPATVLARADATRRLTAALAKIGRRQRERSEEHTSELQSLAYLVCRL